MSFTIRNKTIAAKEIKDLGLTLAASADLSLLGEDPADIQSSADLLAFIGTGDIVVLDPIDGVELNIANSTEVVNNANDPHYALNDSDVRITTEGTGISFKNLRAANTRMWSAGAIDSIAVTDGGAGTVDVAAGEGFFRTSASETAPFELGSWPSVTGQVLTDNVTQFVYADYNAGSPVVAVTTDLSLDGTGTVNQLNTILLAIVDRDGTTVTIFNGNTLNNPVAKVVERLIDAEGLTHPQGAGTLVQDLGSQNIGLTSGSFWLGLINIPHSSFDTSAADTFQYWRRDGAGGWIEVAAAASIWDNLQYDADPGLTALSSSRYTVVWIYLELGDNSSELHAIYGTSNVRNVTEALAEDLPGIGTSLPPPLQRLGVFVGRFIVQRSATTATLTVSAFQDGGGAGGGTQNLWETISSDAGSTAADSPTDTLTISGGSAMTTAISGDTVTVAVVDDPILTGDGSVTVPTGTTGERPGAPVAGMLRYNETTGLMEYYNGTEWVNLSGNTTGPGTVKGNILGYHYLEDKFAYETWLGTTSRHITSDQVQYVMPFDGEIVALTYGCSTTLSDLDVYVEFAEPGAANANVTKFLWKIRDARVAHNSFDGEEFTIDFAGVTGASLPTGATPAAWFDVTAATSAVLYPGKTYRFWFADGSTTVPATPAGGAVVAIPFTGAETAQAISDLVVTAMVTTSGEADFANADNAGGTTTLVSCKLVFAGDVTDTADGTVGTGAAFTVVANGGPFGLPVTRGGKLAVFGSDPGAGVNPTDVVLSVFIQWTNEPQLEAVETYAGDFTAP